MPFLPSFIYSHPSPAKINKLNYTSGDGHIFVTLFKGVYANLFNIGLCHIHFCYLLVHVMVLSVQVTVVSDNRRVLENTTVTCTVLFQLSTQF